MTTTDPATQTPAAEPFVVAMEGPTGRRPLDADALGKIDAYWRAANYLSVGQIYLRDNPLLREPLTPEHIKPRLLGHWGTTPGLNFIYVHLNRVIRERDLNMIFITGPGHGGPALVAQHLPRGHLQRDLPAHLRRTPRACSGCSRSSRSPAASPATSRPRRPARSTRAASSATRSRTPTAPCSTTPTSSPAAWSATARRRPGRWRRAGTRTSSSTRRATAPCCRSCTSTATRSRNPTVLAASADEELRAAAHRLRLRTPLRRGRRAGGDAPADGRDARRVLRRDRGDPAARRARPRPTAAPALADDRAAHAEGLDRARRRSTACRWRARGARTRCRFPSVRTNPEHLAQLEAWMASYRPEELFDARRDAAARSWRRWRRAATRRMGANPHANGGLLLQRPALPDFRDYAVTVPAPGASRPRRRACWAATCAT